MVAEGADGSSSPWNAEHTVVILKDDASNLGHPLLQGYIDHDGSFLQQYSGASFGRTILNMINAISGIGVLSMPYALSLGGWLSLAMFIFVACVCYYTGLLIQRCMDADPSIKTYPGVGEFAFGRKGKTILSGFMYLELYLVSVSFLVLEGDNLDKLFPHASLEIASVISIQGKRLFVLISALLILPTTWLRSLGMLAYVSAGGLVASVVLLGSLLWASVDDETGFHHKGRLLSLDGLPTALGLFFVCFTCHAVFPTIHSSMRDNTQFSKVLSISFALCTLNYGVMGILGYLMYGEKVESQVTLNLTVGKLYSRIAIYTTLMNPLSKFALTISPMATAIEDGLIKLCKGKYKSASFFIRTLLLASTVVIALEIPYFAYMMAFVGSVLCVIVSVLFPCLCYLKIFGVAGISRLEMVNISGILVVGVLIAVLGTHSSLREIVHNSYPDEF